MLSDKSASLYPFAKRIFDIFFAFLGLLLFLPLMFIISIVILITSPGPILYPATRVGKDGKLFKMYKFRTMVKDADKIGPLVTAGNDPRITPIGRFLRKSKWDELPSLWNVLKGDMSFVGPRPENPKSASLYNEEQKKVLSVKPGITSLATIKYRNEEDILEEAESLEEAYFQIMQDKLNIELEYIQNPSLWNDIKIIFQTLKEIVR
ncbi:MAG: sugar transferase [Calditrichaeota bacterium]|nr:MAG: sugar transferase [Calditrichota bacterium]